MAQPAYQYPPPAGSPAPAPSSVSRPAIGMLAIRVVLTLAGAAGLVVGGFLDWTRTVSGVNLSVRAFYQRIVSTSSSNFAATVGFAMIVLGLLAIVGLAPRSGWLTRMAGALGIAGIVLFFIQLYRGAGSHTSGPGPWLCLAGAIVALMGGFFGTRTVAAAPAAPYTVVPE